MTHKLRLLAFLLAVATMVVYWWRVDRQRTPTPLPSARVEFAPGQPATTSASTPLIGINGRRDPGSRTSGGAAAGSRGTSGHSTARPSSTQARRSGSSAPGKRPANEADTALAPQNEPNGRATISLRTEPADREARSDTATGGIAGTARSSSGAVLPGVEVEARSATAGGRTRTAITGSNGRYRLDALPPGTYTVTFMRAGAAASRRVDVASGVITSGIDAALAPASRASSGR